MHKIIVLGAGRVGRVIARDLNEDPTLEVTLADRRQGVLERIAGQLGCESLCEDLADPAKLQQAVAGFDLAIGALPGALGLGALSSVIAAGTDCVDISFMPEDPRELDGEAKQTGARVLYDFGVAPGMSNLLAATSASELDPARQIMIVVGGLPVLRRKPWEYAAPFSPADVLEEYVRPARIKVGGEAVERPALSAVEILEFPEVGALEAFYTDGLRSLLDTLECPTMEEKTLRYPGYAERIRLLRDSGFLSADPVEVNGTAVRPIDLTLRLLEPAWHLEELMEEFTVMRITVTGGDTKPYTRVVWNLFDRTDRDRGETSMARTTGFPAAIAARRLLDGTLDLEPGVHPPEACSDNLEFVQSLLDDLKSRGVSYRKEGP
jgi:saccharopine dehydrogenase-like NADP-dependent oxidoreductase